MLISVHLPKTAGSSFLSAIEKHYGEYLVQDYGDRPVNRASLGRNWHAIERCVLNSGSKSRFRHTQCIHGHFMPLKYRLLKTSSPKQFVVWMRDPVERLASHYLYWIRNYNPIDAGRLHRKVVEEKWTLERFCLGPEMRNVYSKFFWCFPLEKFDFVGITEYYDSEIDYFSEYILGAKLESVRVNVNPSPVECSYIDDPVFRSQIQAYHQADVALYEQALSLREQRLLGSKSAPAQ
ncbi:MAG: hypothetical protein ACI8QT_000487 [Halioglobus sp.]|jgi:hypothetical protein